MTLVPQFPLGSVLFPSMVLPLHIFELRYRALVEDLLASETQTFGVVLIERGSEVGGDDLRASVGTLSKLVKAEQFPDGRWNIVTVGTERFRVQNWLDDNPYPRAEIELWPDTDEGVVDITRFEEIRCRFRRLMALASEAGVDTGPTPELEATALGVMQLAALLPIETFDKQRLLALPGANERLCAIDTTINETAELIELKLSGG